MNIKLLLHIHFYFREKEIMYHLKQAFSGNIWENIQLRHFPSFKYRRTSGCSPQLKSRQELGSERYSTFAASSKAENNCFMVFQVAENFTVINTNLAQRCARMNFLFWLLHVLSPSFPFNLSFHQQTPQTQGIRLLFREWDCIINNFPKTISQKVKEMLVIVRDFDTIY